jgi:hypothetical protein
MSRRAWLATVVILALGALVLAEPGVVITKDGTTFEGDVIEDDQRVTVTIRGIETVIPRSEVLSLKYRAAYEEEFRLRLAGLQPTDLAGRVALSRDAFDQRRYDLAREALLSALAIDPNNREATDFLELVERQIRLERTAPAAPGPARVASRPPQRPPSGGERRVLSPEDINLIRQQELREDDTGVRITIPTEVKKQFAEQHNTPFSEFNRLSSVHQALQIINEGDPDMKRQIRIASDPASLAEFKRLVQPAVLSHCATSGCHGSAAGGALVLYNPADSDALTYTNFYILSQYQHRTQGSEPGGVFSGSSRKMIERGSADRSLLLNYGLPIAMAEYDHPEVGGKPIQPALRNRQDPRYEQIRRWMDQTLSPIAPNYGINFTLPGAATVPSTLPAR